MSLSLTRSQRPNHEFSAVTKYASHSARNAPHLPSSPSSGSAAPHLVFDLMGFTFLPAHEIIHQGNHILMWEQGGAHHLVTAKPAPLLTGWISVEPAVLSHGHRTASNSQVGNPANMAVTTRWMRMSN